MRAFGSACCSSVRADAPCDPGAALRLIVSGSIRSPLVGALGFAIAGGCRLCSGVAPPLGGSPFVENTRPEIKEISNVRAATLRRATLRRARSAAHHFATAASPCERAETARPFQSRLQTWIRRDRLEAEGLALSLGPLA